MFPEIQGRINAGPNQAPAETYRFPAKVLFLQQDRELPLISVNIAVRGGSVEEPADKTGLVDLYAATWRSGGTQKRSGDQIDDFLGLRAATVETVSDEDSTGLQANFLKTDFDDVFKLIKDYFPPPKETTRELIKSKYLLVKTHDRVGRMADTLEYSNVAFPRARFEEELIDELRKFCPSLLEISDRDGDGQTEVIINHVYIERRMIPLNIFLGDASPSQMEHAVVEYGNAIKDLVAANIFPGDMLWKNFGVTRHGKVVFYDYDEIEYITDCNFRRVPEPRTEEDEMSGEIWYAVGRHDVFPETFGPFLLGNPQVREIFMKHHADLLDPGFWQAHKDRILAGHVHDVFPYDPERRFAARRAAGQVAGTPATA